MTPHIGANMEASIGYLPYNTKAKYLSVAVCIIVVWMLLVFTGVKYALKSKKWKSLALECRCRSIQRRLHNIWQTFLWPMEVASGYWISAGEYFKDKPPPLERDDGADEVVKVAKILRKVRSRHDSRGYRQAQGNAEAARGSQHATQATSMRASFHPEPAHAEEVEDDEEESDCASRDRQVQAAHVRASLTLTTGAPQAGAGAMPADTRGMQLRVGATAVPATLPKTKSSRGKAVTEHTVPVPKVKPKATAESDPVLATPYPPDWITFDRYLGVILLKDRARLRSEAGMPAYPASGMELPIPFLYPRAEEIPAEGTVAEGIRNVRMPAVGSALRSEGKGEGGRDELAEEWRAAREAAREPEIEEEWQTITRPGRR